MTIIVPLWLLAATSILFVWFRTEIGRRGKSLVEQQLLPIEETLELLRQSPQTWQTWPARVAAQVRATVCEILLCPVCATYHVVWLLGLGIVFCNSRELNLTGMLLVAIGGPYVLVLIQSLVPREVSYTATPKLPPTSQHMQTPTLRDPQHGGEQVLVAGRQVGKTETQLATTPVGRSMGKSTTWGRNPPATTGNADDAPAEPTT